MSAIATVGGENIVTAITGKHGVTLLRAEIVFPNPARQRTRRAFKPICAADRGNSLPFMTASQASDGAAKVWLPLLALSC